MTEDAAQTDREQQLVETVVASFANTPDERLRTVLTAVVRHLHALVREVRLTQDEWRQAVDFLTRAGHITDDKRQEFILLSDVLGVSMQTIIVNDDPTGEATEATVVGPFFVADSPRVELGGDISGAAPGEPCWVGAPSATSTGGRRAARGSRSGRPTTTASTTCSMATDLGPGPLFTDQDGRYRFWALTRRVLRSRRRSGG
jgi:hydroxyquinol 1,2-dioxygenase